MNFHTVNYALGEKMNNWRGDNWQTTKQIRQCVATTSPAALPVKYPRILNVKIRGRQKIRSAEAV
jgi:hypothetical protein